MKINAESAQEHSFFTDNWVVAARRCNASFYLADLHLELFLHSDNIILKFISYTVLQLHTKSSFIYADTQLDDAVD